VVNVIDSPPAVPPAVPRTRARRERRFGRGSWIRRLPLVPALLFMFIVTQVPFVLTLWYSLQKYVLVNPTAPRDFPTLYNYRIVFGDPIFRAAVVNTVLFTAAPVILSVLFGIGIALLLNRYVFGRGFLRTLIVSPFLIMPAAAALVWKYTILDVNYGVLNYVLRPFGLHNTDWIGSYSQLTIIAFLTWEWTPFMVLLMLAGLQSQQEDVLEAARVDGAGSWRIFRTLTLRQLRPYIELGSLLGSIYIVQAFDGVFFITSGGPGTNTTNLPYYIYQIGLTGALNIGQASAMAVIVVVATIIIATIALRTIASVFSNEGMAGR
jgi:sorbitol/mannitol transport system permease protein